MAQSQKKVEIAVPTNGTYATATQVEVAQQEPDELGDIASALAPITPSESIDDVELSELIVHETSDIQIASEPLLRSIPVQRPSNQDWFRIRTGDDWRGSVYLLTLKGERLTYLVHPSLAPMLTDWVYTAVLYTGITSTRRLFLWNVRLTVNDRTRGGDTWNQSAHEAAKEAETTWVRIQSSMADGVYHIYTARGLEDPVWPVQAESFQQLVKLAFKEKYISSLDHPIVRQLRGEG